MVQLQTEAGAIEGAVEDGVARFLGVPFAAPPVGPLRWRAPQPAEPWAGIRSAREFAAAAIQGHRPHLPLGTDRKSEDCLYLNIWAPERSGGTALPVMVWLHGGGYIAGAASEPVYDGSALASLGAVVITVNYRLHVFGYLSHPETGANFGLRDQLAALAWVNRHAAELGGDPNNITVFGESAGAGAVRRLLTSPMADRLFHKAILQSGGFTDPVGLKESFGYAQGRRMSQRLFEALGADDAEAMRRIPADVVFDEAEALFGIDLTKGSIVLPHQLPWQPVEDGEVLPFGSSRTPRGTRPLLLGSNANEGRYFFRPERTFSADVLDLVVRELSGESSAAVLPLLDAGSPEAIYRSLDRVFTAAMGSEVAAHMAGQAAGQGSTVYLYRFTRVSPGARRHNVLANHTAELPYVFGTLARGDYYDETDLALSASMRRAWTDFAGGRVPRLDGGVPWPPFRAADPRAAILGDTAEVGDAHDDVLVQVLGQARAACPLSVE